LPLSFEQELQKREASPTSTRATPNDAKPVEAATDVEHGRSKREEIARNPRGNLPAVIGHTVVVRTDDIVVPPSGSWFGARRSFGARRRMCER
jgi:hypothetical protein